MTAPINVESIRIPAFPKHEPRCRGLGLLELLGPQGRISLPLASVKIEAKVAGAVADCTLSQTFQNTSQEPLEAEYIFPLPGGAAVRRFELKVAGRTVVGQVRERGQARRDYAVAIQQGKRAALLEQERGDVFTVSVGNLPAGETAEVVISWSERLPMFDDGTAELRLPLVVAPRYIAGNPIGGAAGSGVAEDTDAVPDASRLTPPRLAPGFDPKISLALAVHLLRDPAQPLEDLSCSQHAVRQRGGPESIQIELAREGELLDRDFVLRWRMAGAAVQPELLVYQPPEGDAFGVLTLVPPRREGFLGLPRDVVFVLDRSGSMEGQKMIWASRACALLLRTLGPRDRFSIQAFDDHVEWFEQGKQRWAFADEAGLEAGEKFLRGVGARGGTELDLAMREALAVTGQRGEKSHGLPVIVLLTDGQIGDESSVLRRLQGELGESRVFTVGIDTAVNAAFLTRLAALGGGTASFVQPGERLEEALRAVGREIGAPLVTDLKVTSGSSALPASALAPALLPDLFAGRPATAFVSMKSIGPLTVTGQMQGQDQGGGTYTATVQPRVVALPALAQLWAKARVSELEDQYRLSAAGAGGRSVQELQKEIVDLAVLHTLLTRFTAFIAVDDEVVNPGGQGKKVTQPVQTPQGWEMDKEQAAGSGGGGAFQPQSRAMAMPSMGAGGMANFAKGGPPPAPPSVAAPAKSSASLLGGLARGLGAVASSVADAFSDKKAEHAEAEESSLDVAADLAAPPPPPSSVAPAPAQTRESKKKAKPSTRAFGPPRAPAPAPSFAPPTPPRDGGPGSAVSDADRAALQAAIEPVTKALEAVRAELAAGRIPDAAALEKARRELLGLLATSPAAAQAGALQKLLRSGLTELVAALRAPGTPVATLLALCLSRQRELEEAKAALGGVGGPAKSEKPFWGASV